MTRPVDDRVPTVDTSGLPPSFGAGIGASGTSVETVATVVMGCWAGD